VYGDAGVMSLPEPKEDQGIPGVIRVFTWTAMELTTLSCAGRPAYLYVVARKGINHGRFAG